MDITGKNILILGGSGEVGMAICGELLPHQPAKLVIASNDGQASFCASCLADELCKECLDAVACSSGNACSKRNALSGVTGNIFVRESLKNLPPTKILKDSRNLSIIVDDIFRELTDEVLSNSALYRLILEHRPDIIIDSVNTATALAYQDAYRVAQDESADKLQALATAAIPALVRHVQILYRAMKAVKTGLYLKIGTTGTGGMGLNIPFTHGEESPSSLLLGKAAAAGAQTNILYVLSQTPDAPVVIELKPASMIGWKDRDNGPIKKRGGTVPLYDVDVPHTLELGATFSVGAFEESKSLGELSGDYINTGENGYFSPEEFFTITSPGLMEMIRPEDIAREAVAEILGRSTSHNVIAAVDAAVMKSTYGAGLQRSGAHYDHTKLPIPDRVNTAIVYGQLGPHTTKLIAECSLIRIYLARFCSRDAAIPNISDITLELCGIVMKNEALRQNLLSIGMPVLMGGNRLLFVRRADRDKVWEKEDWKITPANINKFAEWNWVDLRYQNIERWLKRLKKYSKEKDLSTFNVGEMVAAVLMDEFGGRRP